MPNQRLQLTWYNKEKRKTLMEEYVRPFKIENDILVTRAADWMRE